MRDELLPCPFCGGEAEIVRAVGETWVRCPCGAIGPNIDGIGSDEEAAAAWNRRAGRACRNTDTVPDDGSMFYPSPHFRCSECGAFYALTDYAYYCPSCGAKVEP